MPAPVSAEVCAVALCVGKAEGPGSQAETLGHSQWVTWRGFYAAQRTRVTPRACVPRIIHTKRKWRDCPLQLTFADIFLMLCLLPGSFLPRIWGRSKRSSNAACCTFLAHQTNINVPQGEKSPHEHRGLQIWDAVCPAPEVTASLGKGSESQQQTFFWRTFVFPQTGKFRFQASVSF